jgi:hypothetical protein
MTYKWTIIDFEKLGSNDFNRLGEKCPNRRFLVCPTPAVSGWPQGTDSNVSPKACVVASPLHCHDTY